MTELEYYESDTYREFLLSQRRREICNPDTVFNEFPINNAENLLDFGIGNGFFIDEMRKRVGSETWIWGAECQQDLIDGLLQKKIKDSISNFTPFFMERIDHPLLPEWMPKPDITFTSLCLSTFPNPGMAMDGLIQSMNPGGRLIILDWTKLDYPEGPKLKDKVSLDKMRFLAEDSNLEIVKTFRPSEFIYVMEVKAGKDFQFGHYNLDEEANESSYSL